MLSKSRRLMLLPVLALAIAGCGGGTHHKAVHAATTTTASSTSAKCAGGYLTPYGCQAHSATFGLPPRFAARPPALTGVSTAEMFDTVTLSTVPGNPFAVAGYTSGLFPTFVPLVNAFPRAHHISIAINAFHAAQCLDVEPLDAVPSQAGQWVIFDRAHGFAKPCLYSSLLNGMGGVEANLAATLGPSWRSQVFLWDADWTGSPHIDRGFDATQWTDHSLNRNLDESTVTLAFLGVVPGPSHAQILGWQAARNSSLRAYRAHFCTGQHVRSPVCEVFANRVLAAVTALDNAGVQRKPRCWGRHANLSAAACQVVRPRVALRSRARDASQRAAQRAVCGGAQAVWPDHRKVCVVMAQREHYFARLVNADFRAWR